MKIHLHEQPQAFEKNLENTVEAIKSSSTGISFIANLASLIDAIKAHPITSKWIRELEEEIAIRNKAFKKQAIEALEAEWNFLWKNCQSLHERKELIQIKWFFTKDKESTFFLPFQQASLLISKFKEKFKCFHSSSGFIQIFEQHLHLQMNRKPKLYREYIQTSVDLDPVYLWDRLCLLQKIYSWTPSTPSVKPSIHGKWSETKYQHWQRAEEASTQVILQLASEDVWKSFSGDGFENNPRLLSPFVDPTYHFFREECEGYLDLLLANIRHLLPPQQDPIYRKKTIPEEKTDEVERLGRTFWNQYPRGNYDLAYEYYSDQCKKPYCFEEWQRKIRKLKVDPRSSKEKVRGSSKKGG